MKVDFEDFLRSEENYNARIEALLRGEGDCALLVAHGRHGGERCATLDAKTIVSTSKHQHFWLHSCMCGRILAPQLSAAGFSAFGFLTNILTSESRHDVDMTLQVLVESDCEDPALEIQRRVQRRWHEEALSLMDGETPRILAACVLTHMSLALRSFAGIKEASQTE